MGEQLFVAALLLAAFFFVAAGAGFLFAFFAAPPSILMIIGMAEHHDGMIVAGAIGMAVVMIPLSIMTLPLSNFAYALIAEGKADPIEAVKASVQGIFLNLFGCMKLGLALIGILLLGELLCGVGLFVALPFAHIMCWYAHKEIYRSPPDEAEPLA